MVIGRRMRNVDADHALDYVFGYTVANDVPRADLQFGDGQWTRGKSLDTFCPLGPVIVTPDELGPIDDLRLTTRVNGETMQDDSTASMIFGVPADSRALLATLHARARRRGPHGDSLGLRRVHGSAPLPDPG